jgi:hypothetical protein
VCDRRIHIRLKTWVILHTSLQRYDADVDLLLLHLLNERNAYHCGWAPMRQSDPAFGQNWKPGTREFPLLFSNYPKVSFRCMNHRHLETLN